MEKEIISKELGSEGDLGLRFEGTDLYLEVKHGSKGVEAGISVKVKGDYFLDLLAEKIPGEVDDAIIGVLKGALKA